MRRAGLGAVEVITAFNLVPAIKVVNNKSHGQPIARTVNRSTACSTVI